MRRIHSCHKLLFFVYSCALLALGSYFLVRDKVIMRSHYGDLPIDFIVRFGMFWFISFVLALLFFMLHIYLNKYYFSDSEILQSSKVGKLAFTLGTGAAVAAVLLYVSLY